MSGDPYMLMLYWLVDGLEDAGYQVHLTNPGGIKMYEGLSTVKISPMLHILHMYCA